MRELTDDEKYKIERQEDYISFIDRSARIVERAMAENQVDIFTDYTGRYTDDTERLIVLNVTPKSVLK